MEMTLHFNCIYCFSTEQNRLSCLAYVVNLAFTDFMSIIIGIAHMETLMAIWEFDLTLSQNQVLVIHLMLLLQFGPSPLRYKTLDNILHTLSSYRRSVE
jgi:hypothetical protein